NDFCVVTLATAPSSCVAAESPARKKPACKSLFVNAMMEPKSADTKPPPKISVVSLATCPKAGSVRLDGFVIPAPLMTCPDGSYAVIWTEKLLLNGLVIATPVKRPELLTEYGK